MRLVTHRWHVPFTGTQPIKDTGVTASPTSQLTTQPARGSQRHLVSQLAKQSAIQSVLDIVAVGDVLIRVRILFRGSLGAKWFSAPL